MCRRRRGDQRGPDSSTPFGSPDDPDVGSTTAQSSARAARPVRRRRTRRRQPDRPAPGRTATMPSSTSVSADSTASGVPGTRRNVDISTERTARARRPAASAATAFAPRLTQSPPMATPAQWIEGARPRTLPAAIAPVLVGTGAAAYLDGFVWWKALLALGVALALQIGVNYANDYSDGIRGTDDDRVGPLRLVGSKVGQPADGEGRRLRLLRRRRGAGLVARARPPLVAAGRRAARSSAPGSTPAARSRTGTAALGEVSVFVFFGLVAVLGTTYVQAGRLHWTRCSRRRRRSAHRLRAAGRQQPARHPHRHRHRQAHARRASSALRAPGGSTPRWSRSPSSWPRCRPGHARGPCSRCSPCRWPQAVRWSSATRSARR